RRQKSIGKNLFDRNTPRRFETENPPQTASPLFYTDPLSWPSTSRTETCRRFFLVETADKQTTSKIFHPLAGSTGKENPAAPHFCPDDPTCRTIESGNSRRFASEKAHQR